MKNKNVLRRLQNEPRTRRTTAIITQILTIPTFICKKYRKMPLVRQKTNMATRDVVTLQWKIEMGKDYQKSWCRSTGHGYVAAEKRRPMLHLRWSLDCFEWTCTTVVRLVKYHSSNHCAASLGELSRLHQLWNKPNVTATRKPWQLLTEQQLYANRQINKYLLTTTVIVLRMMQSVLWSHTNQTVFSLSCMSTWRGGTMGRVLDLRSTGRGFKSYSLGQKLHNNLWQLVHT